MAKVTGPLMSLDASGTVGKTTVFAKWKGRNYVRLRVTPLNPRTDSQQVVRQKLGSIGFGNSFVVGAQDPIVEDSFYEKAKAAAPAGQSWISFAAAQIAGAGLSNWDDMSSGYAGLIAGDKTLYTTAATNLGMSDFTIANPPTAPAEVVKGELLYHLLAFAITDLAYVLTAGTLNDPDEAGLANFVEYVKAGT